MTHPRLVRFGSREEWLEARRLGVGGSDAPAILGLSPWSSPLSLWMRKVGIIDDLEESEAMRWGSLLEPLVIRELSREAGIDIEHLQHAILRHPAHPDLFCSPDGFCEDGTLVEAKTTNAFRAAAWEEGPPPIYEAQVQHSLACCPEAPRALVAVLIGGSMFRWCRVERDPSWEAENLPKLVEFARMLREQEPPATTGHEKDREALDAYFPRENAGEVVDLGSEALTWHEELVEIAGQRKALDARERKLKDMIRERIRLANYGLLPGGAGAYRWSTESRKGYTVAPSESRVLRFVKKVREGEE